jgi:hypothetical protein
LELEKRYPTPTLFLESPLLPKAYVAVTAILDVYRPISMSKVLSNLLTERSVEYISLTRAESRRMSQEKYAREDAEERAWKQAEGPLKNMAALVKGNEGPFVMGTTREWFLVSRNHTNTYRR